MTNELDLRLVVKHIANGTLGENLCRICLLPLTDLYENIFTKICKENEEICIADILKEICNIQFSDSDHFNVCSVCVISTWNAYKLYLHIRRNDELLNFYADNLLYNLDALDSVNTLKNENMFISLPVISPAIPYLDCDVTKICVKKNELITENDDTKNREDIKKPLITESKKVNMEVSKELLKNMSEKSNEKLVKTEQDDDDDDIVIIMNERGQPSFFKMLSNGDMVEIEYDDRCRNAYRVIMEEMPRKRVHKKKREPMTWKQCTKCPIKYRFVAKLREHMWHEHGILLYSCKICKALMEEEDEYQFHMSTHTNEYQCEKCNIVFKKRDTIISHLALHNKRGKRHQNTNYVCKECGKIMKDEESWKIHIEEHNLKEYTCYYCGRMYKKEIGFNNHIRKHEMYMKLKEIRQKQGEKRSIQLEKQKLEKQMAEQKQSKEFTCEVCGRTILSERALLWHRRLHTNERPFTCKTCGRGFVSSNRCKQHALCAHTTPKLRCPLCPALFHMRSMVNSHIKKVHLKSHKRRTRTVRQHQVFWQTETVPIQELSVAIQSDIIELQAANKTATDDGMFVD
ncbi:unnamed protein product [Diatraea saccharalis]|uniref:Uncharacterized protein n=1 Tax=Diatraea saccharalis TaxID=40085 RepID=A0A9N9R5N9_9NEOP|nr:unnamed protein product [Diatraea saccharalis]